MGDITILYQKADMISRSSLYQRPAFSVLESSAKRDTTFHGEHVLLLRPDGTLMPDGLVTVEWQLGQQTAKTTLKSRRAAKQICKPDLPAHIRYVFLPEGARKNSPLKPLT